jgi:hypothetical protein
MVDIIGRRWSITMPDKCVERFDPTLDRIIDTSRTIHDFANGACADRIPDAAMDQAAEL